MQLDDPAWPTRAKIGVAASFWAGLGHFQHVDDPGPKGFGGRLLKIAAQYGGFRTGRGERLADRAFRRGDIAPACG